MEIRYSTPKVGPYRYPTGSDGHLSPDTVPYHNSAVVRQRPNEISVGTAENPANRMVRLLFQCHPGRRQSAGVSGRGAHPNVDHASGVASPDGIHGTTQMGQSFHVANFKKNVKFFLKNVKKNQIYKIKPIKTKKLKNNG